MDSATFSFDLRSVVFSDLLIVLYSFVKDEYMFLAVIFPPIMVMFILIFF